MQSVLAGPLSVCEYDLNVFAISGGGGWWDIFAVSVHASDGSNVVVVLLEMDNYNIKWHIQTG